MVTCQLPADAATAGPSHVACRNTVMALCRLERQAFAGRRNPPHELHALANKLAARRARCTAARTQSTCAAALDVAHPSCSRNLSALLLAAPRDRTDIAARPSSTSIATRRRTAILSSPIARPLRRLVACHRLSAATTLLPLSTRHTPSARPQPPSVRCLATSSSSSSAASSCNNITRLVVLRNLLKPVPHPPPTMAAADNIHGDMTLDDYTFPHSRLRRRITAPARTPLVLIACGSFSPITFLHLRMFEMAADYARFNTQYEVVGAYLSCVGDAYKKTGLVKAEHRINMCQLAVAQSSWISVDPWEALHEEYLETAKVLDHFHEEINVKLGGVETPEGRKECKVALLAGADLIQTMSTPGVWADKDIDYILKNFGAFIVEVSSDWVSCIVMVT